jgi:hypothetical protein
MQRKFTVIALVVLGVGLFAPPVFGQATTAGIRGKVVDATGGIPMAQVVAVNTQSGFTYQATADAEGNFTLAGLVPGTYDVKVSSEAYTEQTVRVQVLLGQDALVNVTMSPTEVFMGDVTVVGETTKLLIDTRNPTITTNITTQQMDDLPQNNRNFLSFAQLAPGVGYTYDNDAAGQTFRAAVERQAGQRLHRRPVVQERHHQGRRVHAGLEPRQPVPAERRPGVPGPDPELQGGV